MECSSSDAQRRPAVLKKSFTSDLQYDEDEPKLSMARSLKSRSKRMSSMASSLLYKLEVRKLGADSFPSILFSSSHIFSTLTCNGTFTMKGM